MDAQVAILGGGCFWCLEPCFLELDGVLDVESGYCGGHVANPSYEAVCSGTTGHAEVVKVRFDPARIGYRELLEVFFAIHDPTTPDRQGNDVGPQYRSAIFPQDAQQEATARDVIASLEAERVFDAPIVTRIEGSGPYYAAEAYHQRFYENNPSQGYCRMVVAPKLAKFRRRFAGRRRA